MSKSKHFTFTYSPYNCWHKFVINSGKGGSDTHGEQEEKAHETHCCGSVPSQRRVLVNVCACVITYSRGFKMYMHILD